MFGVIIVGPENVLCDYQSVVNNTSKLESILNRKHSSISYHAVKWSVAEGIMRVEKVHMDENISNTMTNLLIVERRNYLFGNCKY